MTEAEEDLPKVYVEPGESRLVRGPAILWTVLGSCLGIVFWVPRLGVSALCHPMLPRCPEKSPANTSLTVGRRYVDFTIRDLVRRLYALGARRREVEVKLFGGGDVLWVSEDVSRPTVGELNCEVAMKELNAEGLDVKASSLRGTCGVNIRFNTLTGEVLLKRHSKPLVTGMRERKA
jgi:chemotaxis receptor (MCP) glutamine deamidase CheD